MRTKIVKIVIPVLVILMVLTTVVPLVSYAETETTDRWQDYIGKRIGVLTGTPLEAVAEENFAGSEILYFNSYPDLAAALLAGEVDAYLCDEPGANMTHHEEPRIDYIHERLTKNDYAFAFRKNDADSAALLAEFNAFLEKIKEDGTYEEIEDIWFGTDESRKVVDMEGLTEGNKKITIATTSTDMPWSYIKDNKNVGFDIDIVARFCKENGYALSILDVDFAGRIPALQSGKCDFTTDMNVTPERQEEVLFSEATADGGVVVVTLAENLSSNSSDEDQTTDQATDRVPEFQTFEELGGKTISMLTGAPFEELISSKVSDVKEFTYYQSMPDMMLAIRAGKTDAGFLNNAVAELAANREEDLEVFPESLGDTTFGLGFPKGSDKYEAWQKAYDSIPKETLDSLWSKWTGADDSIKTLPSQDWAGTNGTVQVAACDALEPMSYVGQDGQLLGLDIEVILLIAKELDVHVEFTPMDFSAVLSTLGSGKADVGCGSIVVTDERKESMDFIEYLPASYVLIVRSVEAGTAKQTDSDDGDGIASSFYKTFVREDRYKLFLSGILTTVIITVLSIIFGTALGFAVYMCCRKNGRISTAITGFCAWLIQGMPVVVLLMILYYIIFAKADISGTAVAVIAFTLVFGFGVFGLLHNGVGTIDKGQTEAAYALGYGDVRTFFRIILPQVVPHILPAYKGEIVALLKATAIVGYIAVQDITKMGDIVRGRTYEAFFPLIAVAIMYFILAAILKFIVRRVEVLINPRRRKRENILKGVKIDD